MTFASMTPKQRSAHMALIRGSDTKPELRVRDALRAAKIRFSTNVASLPGTPDVVVRDARVAVMVHGCFWHKHGCKPGAPRTNRTYWRKKLDANVARDREKTRQLRLDGWRVVVVWECQLKRPAAMAALIAACQGRCRCGSRTVPGAARCARCLKDMRQAARRRNLEYKRKKRCRQCARRPLPGRIRCWAHQNAARKSALAAVRRLVKRRIDDEQCVRCARSSKTYYCRKCQKARARVRAKKASLR